MVGAGRDLERASVSFDLDRAPQQFVVILLQAFEVCLNRASYFLGIFHRKEMPNDL